MIMADRHDISALIWKLVYFAAIIFLLVAMFGAFAAYSKEAGDQWDMQQTQAAYGFDAYARGSIVGGRPAACYKFPATKKLYCGCASALYIGLPNEDGRWNKASRWFVFPPAAPGPGMAEVRSNHVAIIIGFGSKPGTYRFYDPNSGRNLTRIVERPLRGKVVNPRARLASAQ